jgi:soluble lytic murein transglycosylase-like protein
MSTGEKRRETDQVTSDESAPAERRHNAENVTPHRRRKQDFFTKYRQPLIGLGLVGAALPLANAQQQAEHEKAPVEPAAEQAPASAEATAAAKSGDAEEALVAKIANSRADESRETHIQTAMAKYKISEELATDIYDIAQQEGVPPNVAYGLVRTESTFKEGAVSNVGARGLTQLMPKTAKWLVPGTKAQDLFNRKTSLKIGFRYLTQLTERYRGNVKLALLAYNRGPGTVDKVLKKGGNPDNGYASKVLGG